MGAIAARLADFAWITSDNPRSEEPGSIIREIVEGVRSVVGARKSFAIIPDRKEAIRAAIRWARAGDTVLIAGKGHETTQIIGGRVFPFDDREVARAIVKEQGR
jgi:UDP-N-acetylmuramoyl-L-alanyl-D-glutamate--2,6-diaminopimelate ligase